MPDPGLRTTLLCLALAALILAPPALATGGWYGADGRYHAAEEEDPCEAAGHGKTVSTRDGTTGIKKRPDGTDYWYHVYVHTCEDGAEVETEEDRGDVVYPTAGYEPSPGDPPPGPGCDEGYYDDEGWHQGTCR